MRCLYDNVVVRLNAVKETSLHFIERLKQNTDVDLRQQKQNRLISKSNSAANLRETAYLRKYYNIQATKRARTRDSLPKEVSANSIQKQIQQKENKDFRPGVCESHLKKGSLGMAWYKSRNHRTEVLFLLVISVSFGSFHLGHCKKIGTNLSLTTRPTTFNKMIQAKDHPFVPSNQEEQNKYFEFLTEECKKQGGNCTYWTDLKVSDKGINKALSRKGKDPKRPCEYYHRKGNRYERIGCYRPEIVAVCTTATLQNDGRCELLKLKNGTRIPICILAEAPSMLGAQQICLGLGGSILHPSQWDPAFKKKFEANGENQFWASSDFSIEHSNGSEVDFFVRYSKLLDFKKKCLVAEIRDFEFNVKTAGCNELHHYVYERNQSESGEKTPNRDATDLRTWKAIGAICIILLVIISGVVLVKKIRSKRKHGWKRDQKVEEEQKQDNKESEEMQPMHKET